MSTLEDPCYPSEEWFHLIGFPEGNKLSCRSPRHDVCVVTPDGRHHTYCRWNPERGTVVTRSTKHDYHYGVVRCEGVRLVLKSCHWDAQAARNKSQPGDQIVGLTRAPLAPLARRYQVNVKERLFVFPLCYACAKPGLGRAEQWYSDKKRRIYVPACITQHAMKEKS
jgi:hypothetical protein